MLVSWNWLRDYVPLEMPLEELERRLTMAGLNHEGTRPVGEDWAIDLEVTSNRPDCLSHIGIAREIAVLWNLPLRLPQPRLSEGPTPAEKLVRVRLECPDLCWRYTARVIRGVRVAPSPAWLARRLEAVGITPINNVVDISNYVLMECGQPLHTFDFGKLRGGEIVVRRPQPGESIEAIDHKVYVLPPDACLICDAEVPVAIGGVMGGAETEISAATRDVLVEAAEFAPISIRDTARKLNLHSESSYRFERGVDPVGVDWAGRRCCELILELAGGELASGIVDVGRQPSLGEPITLRYEQLKRILGIDIPLSRAREILLSLGNVETEQPVAKSSGAMHPREKKSPPQESKTIVVIPPSWRRDLSREIDLIEEVGRIYGYEAVPVDVIVPMAASARRREDRVLEKIRHVLTAAGFNEALTLSVVDEQSSASFSPWTTAEPLRTQTPVVRGADCLRRSLTPSLLLARRSNEALGNQEIELFEIARVYLPQEDRLPLEELMLGLTSGKDFLQLKGVIEAVMEELKIDLPIVAEETRSALLDPAAACRLLLDGEIIAYLGNVTEEGRKRFDLRGPAGVAEVRLQPLIAAARLMPRCTPLSPYPAVSRDLNLVVDESVRWAALANTVRSSAGRWLEDLQYRETYRDSERLGENRKSLVFTITLRNQEGTLTNQEADEIRDRVVRACRAAHGAELRS